MKLVIFKREMEVELQTIIITLVCLVWSIVYYFSTVEKPDGPESVIFIRPLLIILIISAFPVLASSISFKPKSETEGEKDPGLWNLKRAVFIVSLFVYAAILPYLGFLIPSLLYLLCMSFFLGLRKSLVFIGLLAGYTILLWGGFRYLMEVPIPIFPIF